MTSRYDPLTPPDPALWQTLDEQEQIDSMTAYHRAHGVHLPNPGAHAVLHVVIENQVALGQAIPVAATLVRLQNEGLDRHEALHAIASVMAGCISDALASGEVAMTYPQHDYYRHLEGLTAASWRQTLT